METKDLLLIIAAFLQVLGIVAIPFIINFRTKKQQEKKEKRDAKISLFKTLMMYRKPEQFESLEWFNALNLIDVVFQDETKVRNAWKEYRNFLDHPITDIEKYYLLRLTMLSEIGKSLGYKDFTASDYNNYYVSRKIVQNQKNYEDSYHLLANLGTNVVSNQLAHSPKEKPSVPKSKGKANL